MNELYPQYAQVLSVGLLWVTLHCSGMCGPIMIGLTAGGGGRDTPAARAWWSARRVLAYQGGRGLMYALLGALAGGLGAALEDLLSAVSHVAGLVVAALLLGAALLHLPALQRLRPGSAALGSWSGRLLARALRLTRAGRSPGQSAWWRMALVGFAMGLLPCMLMFWVLGLAASTAHPAHGAAVMLLLVALTTPMLLLTGVLPHLLGGRWRAQGERLLPWGLALSGLWLGLISAAANGWIAHVHFAFHLGGEPFAVMLW